MGREGDNERERENGGFCQLRDLVGASQKELN